MEKSGLATLPVSSGGTLARENGSELGNAASPVLDSGQGGDADAEEALAELLAGWLGRRRGGAAGKARRDTLVPTTAMRSDVTAKMYSCGTREYAEPESTNS